MFSNIFRWIGDPPVALKMVNGSPNFRLSRKCKASATGAARREYHLEWGSLTVAVGLVYDPLGGSADAGAAPANATLASAAVTTALFLIIMFICENLSGADDMRYRDFPGKRPPSVELGIPSPAVYSASPRVSADCGSVCCSASYSLRLLFGCPGRQTRCRTIGRVGRM
jgi:hypothetical protein